MHEQQSPPIAPAIAPDPPSRDDRALTGIAIAVTPDAQRSAPLGVVAATVNAVGPGSCRVMADAPRRE